MCLFCYLHVRDVHVHVCIQQFYLRDYAKRPFNTLEDKYIVCFDCISQPMAT